MDGDPRHLKEVSWSTYPRCLGVVKWGSWEDHLHPWVRSRARHDLKNNYICTFWLFVIIFDRNWLSNFASGYSCSLKWRIFCRIFFKKSSFRRWFIREKSFKNWNRQKITPALCYLFYLQKLLNAFALQTCLINRHYH